MTDVLLIIDHVDDRLRLMGAFERVLPGIVLHAPGSVQAFEQALVAGTCELVITDDRLGWSDGLAILQALRTRVPHCPVIIVSDNPSIDAAVAAIKAGADDYITKSPSDETRLIAAACRLIERTATRRTMRETAQDVTLAREQAMRAAELAQQRLTFLADASALLASSLDYDTTLAHFVQLALGRIADWCSIYLQDTTGVGRWVASCAIDPTKQAALVELHAHYPPEQIPSTLVYRVLTTGEPAFVPHVTKAMRAAVAIDQRHVELYQTLDFHSYMVVPLQGHSQPRGLLVTAMTGTSRDYTADDLLLAKELARRAAMALEHAQLYREVQEQREWFRTTLASIGDAVIVTDTVGCIRFMNGVAEQLTGWAASDALGQMLDNVFRIINETSRATVESPVERVLREGMTVGLANHTLLLAKDGREICIDDSGAPIPDAAGVIQGVVLVFRDTTARQRSETELRQSRDQLAIILRGITDGIFVQKASGELVYINETAARRSGFLSVEEALATPPPHIRQRFVLLDETGIPLSSGASPARPALRGDAETEDIVHFRDLVTGGEGWSAVSATPVRDQQGQIELVVTIFRDITAQKRAEQIQRFLSEASATLAGSLDEQTTLQTVASLAVPTLADWCVVDMLEPDGSLKTVAVAHVDPNKVAMGWEVARRYPLDPAAPYGAGEVLRTGQWELLPDISDAMLEAAARDADHVRLARELGLRANLCVPLVVDKRAVGTLGLVSAQPHHFGSEEIAVTVEFARRIGLALENARLYAAAQAAISIRDQFLSIASHELRTPMTGLMGYVTVLQRHFAHNDLLSPRDLRAIQVIGTQAERLNILISSLLDISRIQMGQLSIEPTPFDLRDLARQVAEEIEPTLNRHTLTLALPNEPVIIQGDSVRLEQVVQNLIQNAVKYSPRGGPIELIVALQSASANLTVQDQGIGIPQEALPQLFHRFYRASNVDSGKISGMGLGLFVVHEIMGLHGGTVDVESTEGRGSRFTLTFPLAPDASATAR